MFAATTSAKYLPLRNLPCHLSMAAQRGSALMMAVFIMVVLMLLGTTLMQLLSSGNEAIAQEVLGTRALAAANSGAQAHLQKLFPLNGAALQCSNAPQEYDFDGIPGLYQCKAVATCDNYVTHDTVNYYRITSTGGCGSGEMATDSNSIVLSSRTVQVEARDL